MIEIFAPNDFSSYVSSNIIKIFLGGSIEQGVAKPWQKRVVSAFKPYNVVLLNPRRPDWDSSWRNVASNKNFRAQVEWELTGLEQCQVAIMYFDPATKSPISLLETGLFAQDEHKLRVVCPSGFWRKGNVDIVCQRYGILQYPSLKQAIDSVLDHFGLV